MVDVGEKVLKHVSQNLRKYTGLLR